MKKHYILFFLVFWVGTTFAQKRDANVSSFSDSIGVSNNNICTNDCINFYDSISNRTSWSWSFPGAIDSISTDQNPQNICYQIAGTFNVMLTATYSGGIDTIFFTDFITVNPPPPTPDIRQSNDTLYCSIDSSYVSYQWYDSSTAIPGATDSFLVVAIQPCENYNVVVCNLHGCCIADGLNILCAGINALIDEKEITIYPNPATNQLTIHTTSFHNEGVMVSVVDVMGREASPPAPLQGERGDGTIYIGGLSAGIYFLQLKWESGSVVKMFVKE